jgi:hypothetical protein
VESAPWLRSPEALTQRRKRNPINQLKGIMSSDNRVSAAITNQTVTDIVGHLTAIQALLPFLISRPQGETNVMLGERSVGFDEKCGTYMESNPEFIPGYIDAAEVLKDRVLRAQLNKFLPQLELLAAKARDTFDIVGNELMMVDLAFYNATGDAGKRGIANAGDIHRDLATRYPGRPAARPAQTAAKLAVA